MKEKTFFYFADPKSFKYPLYIKLLFTRKENYYLRIKDHSKWKEVNDYNYYGEPVNCIIPLQQLDFDFVYQIFIRSQKRSNVFGAINYLMVNYRNEFISQIKSLSVQNENVEILFRYFKDCNNNYS